MKISLKEFVRHVYSEIYGQHKGRGGCAGVHIWFALVVGGGDEFALVAQGFLIQTCWYWQRGSYARF